MKSLAFSYQNGSKPLNLKLVILFCSEEQYFDKPKPLLVLTKKKILSIFVSMHIFIDTQYHTHITYTNVFYQLFQFSHCAS